MPTVPQTKSVWVDQVDALSSTNLNAYLRDPLAFLMNKPVAELRQNSGQSIPTGNYTSVLWNLETVDTDPDGIGGHSTASNTSRYTARYAGWYRVGGSVTFTGNATGRRSTRWMVNGTPVAGGAMFQAAGHAGALGPVAPDPLVFLAEGDFLELQVFQDSGVALGLLTSSENQPRMTVQWERL